MLLPRLEWIWHPTFAHTWQLPQINRVAVPSLLAVRELAGPDPLLNRRDTVAAPDSHVKALAEQDSRTPKSCSRVIFPTTAGVKLEEVPRRNKGSKNEKNNRDIRRGPPAS